MLLNAAHVVTAAENCDAIDETTGRIPINFLLSRSTDLDASVKHQLEQLAATSPSITIHAPAPDSDAEMTDLHCAEPSLPDNRARSEESHIAEEARRAEELRSEEALEMLQEIDLARGDRGERARRGCRAQTLTRKAIRKHTGTKRGPGGSSTSTVNTVAGSDGMLSSIASSASGGKLPRRRWQEWEDRLLMQVVAEHGPTRWNSLAGHFPGRNGRQVRLRWMNHLQPSLDKRPWREEEDDILLEAHQALGNKWAQISVRLGGRTDNSVKNRYKSIVRRNAREAKMARKME